MWYVATNYVEESMSLKRMVSPSRWYVAICNKTNFDGFYFRKFYLPADETQNADHAAWYFLNMLNHVACLETCCPLEDFGAAGELIERELTPAEKETEIRKALLSVWSNECEGPVKPYWL